MPSPLLDIPAFDPAAFSQVLHHGRVVLACRSLLAYATIVRSGGQCCWHDLLKHGVDFETPDYFLPMYFGDTMVLPQIPPGGFHTRPEHWSGFTRDEQYDGAAGHTSRRVVLEAKGPASKAAGSGSRHRRSRTVQCNAADTPVQSALSTLRKQREAIRVEAYPAAKRKANAANPVTPPNRRVRARTIGTPNVTYSFIERAARRLDASSPAQRTRRRKSQSFLPPPQNLHFLRPILISGAARRASGSTIALFHHP